MNTPPRRYESEHAITRGETIALLCVIGILAFVVYVALVLRPGFTSHHIGSDQLNNGRMIYLAMRGYASDRGNDGAFPTFRDSDSKTAPFSHSNEAFEALISQYLDDKRPLFNKKSAWCRVRGKSKDTEDKVLPGENDWVYVRGLREDSPKDWPLLANAFAPGTLEYVADPKKPGGAWKGTDAVIINVGGSALIVETTKSGEIYFIPRRDKPTANAFAKDGEWLAGEHVEVLYPLPPPAVK